MAAVGQLTGGVAHAFENRPTVIRSPADLPERPNPSEERRRHVDAVSDTAAPASRLTGQLPAVARRQPPLPKVFKAVGSVSALRGMLGTPTELRDRPTLVPEAAAGFAELERGAAGFDVVFSDAVVPGKDGVGFARLAAERHPGLPVLLPSGYSHALARRARPASRCRASPISIEALSRALWAAAGRRAR